MMIKNVIFDLDGTVIKNNQEEFNKKFFLGISEVFNNAGYDGNKFANILMQAVGVMINNDGKHTNEEVFWDFFEKKSNIKKEELSCLFNKFYNKKYDYLNDCITPIKEMNIAINLLKEKGYNIILATNPLFPRFAIEKRAKWGNVDCNMFSYITSFENSSYSKPNINYYKEIIENNHLKEEETIMFGNDLIEDLVIEKIGIPCYIITDNMLNVSNINSCSKKGNYKELLEYINNFESVK